jgi:alcohol dehydrogenase (cytochrome c)
LIGIDEKPVPQEPRQRTSATQPIPRGDAFVPQQVDIAPEDFPLVNQGGTFTPFWKEALVAKPGARGGANWPPSSYDPATNYFYVCATDAANLFKGGEEDEQITPEGKRYLGSAFGGAPIPASGIFAALDMKTNRLVWQQRWKDSCYSGSVTTAGGLVFVGRNDGRLTALNAATGKRLWEFQTGAGLNAPASVFEYEGEEYVVAYSAGSLFAGSPRGDSVWLFSLNGTLKEAEAASTVAREAEVHPRHEGGARRPGGLPAPPAFDVSRGSGVAPRERAPRRLRARRPRGGQLRRPTCSGRPGINRDVRAKRRNLREAHRSVGRR